MSKILVVDDDKAVRSAFQFALDETPCEVIVATDGKDGLDQFRDCEFDLVISDIKMPGMNGIEMIDEIRKLDTQIPIRVITAFAEEFLREIEQAVLRGLNFDLIRKPLERDDIRTIVSAVLGLDFDDLASDVTNSQEKEEFVLSLYLTGNTKSSQLALKNIRQICDQELAGRYTLEVIDIFKDINLAVGDRIIATPTLIKHLPAPIQRIIGDLSDTEKVLLGLDLKKR